MEGAVAMKRACLVAGVEYVGTVVALGVVAAVAISAVIAFARWLNG
jgi:hypothetical protein